MDALTAEINSRFPGRAIGVRADVSDYAEAKRLFDQVTARFGGVDVLINNAGVSHIGLFNEMPPGGWDALMRANVNSVFNCCHLAAPYMIAKKHGVVINISSVWGLAGASCEAVYSASKGAVNSFTKALAKELGPSGVRVNAIACGVIDTGMNDWLDDEEKTALTDRIPLTRFGSVSEIANLTVFLASEASAYITGQVIAADGGFI
jgi:3-oxoacyl-[acyl-carrier protein] reductase